MEKKQISIYDPNIKPYGRLSNNYKSIVIQPEKLMEKSGIKSWGSVTGFIYGNLVKTLVNKRLIKNISSKHFNIDESGRKVKRDKKYKNISKLYSTLIREEKNTYIIKAITKAYEDVLLQNQHDLQDLILSIKTKEIKYISDDNLLGTGKDGNGENMLGKILISLRKKILNKILYEKKKQDDDLYKESMYKLYLIYKEIKNNHFRNIFSDRFNLLEKTNLGELLRELNIDISSLIKYPSIREEAFMELLDSKYQIKDVKTLLTMVYNSKNDNNKVRTMINGVLKLNIHEFAKNEKMRIPNIILKNYIEYNLEIDPKYSELNKDQKKKCVKETLYKTDVNRVAKLKSDVVRLYETKKLPKDLWDNIEVQIRHLNTPTEKEIKDIASFELDNSLLEDIKPEDKKLVGVFILNGKKPYDERYKYLLPFVLPNSRKTTKKLITEISNNKPKDLFADNFIIDGKKYPTIMHYVYYYLFRYFIDFNAHQKKKDKVNLIDEDYSYNILKKDGRFLTYKSLKKIYSEKNIEIEKNRKEELAKKGIIIKFKNRNLQDVLLSTYPFNIIYADKYDDILGVGKNKDGKNRVGEILVKLRDKLRSDREKERKSGSINHLSSDDIDSLVTKNPIVREWIKIKIRDICNIFNIMNYYSLEVYKNELDPDKKCEPEKTKKMLQNVPSFKSYKSPNKILAIIEIQRKVKTWLKGKKKLVVKRRAVLKSVINSVINNIYNQCSNIYYYTKKVNLHIPDWFVSVVKRNTNFENSSQMTISCIWKHIVVLLFYLIKNSNESESDLINLISKSTYFLQNKELRICNKVQFSESFSPLQNCIILAALNCIKNILNFDKFLSTCLRRKQVINIDALLKTSKNIILGKAEPLIINKDKPIEIIKDVGREEFEKQINKQIEDEIKKKKTSRDMEGIIENSDVEESELESLSDDSESKGMSSKNLDDLILEALYGQEEEKVENIYGITKYIENNFPEINDIDIEPLAKGVYKLIDEVEESYSVPKNIKYARIKFFG